MEDLKGRLLNTRSLARIFLALLFLASFSLVALAQSASPKPVQEIPPVVFSPPTPSAPNQDETFELNIVERRYSQDNFEAATAVGINRDDQKLKLQIGVAFVSGRINLLLRNVHGVVRFRGTLDRALQILKDRQALSPANSSGQVPVPPPDRK